MKKVIACIAVMMLFLAACGQPEQTEDNNAKRQKKDQYQIGLTYKQAGDYDKAQAAFLEAVDEEPGKALSYLELADLYIRQEKYQAAWDILQQGLEETESAEIEDKLLDFNKANVICDSDGRLRGKSHFQNDRLAWCHIYTYEEDVMTGITHYDGAGNQLGFVEMTYDQAGAPTQSYIYYTSTGALERLTMEYDQDGRLARTEEYALNGDRIGYSENIFDEDGYKIGETYYDTSGEVHWSLSYTHDIENRKSTRITSFYGKQVGVSEQTYSESGYPNGGKSRFQGAYDRQISYDVSYGGSHEREETFEGEETYARIIHYNAPLRQLY